MTYTELFSRGDSFYWDGNSHKKHALKGTNSNNDPFFDIDPFGGRAKNMITENGTFFETKYGVDLGGRGTNNLFNLDDLANDGADFSIRLHGAGPSMELARDIFNSPKGKLYIDVTDSNGALTEGFKELLDAAFDIGKYAAGNSFAGRVLQNGDGDFVVQIAAEAHNGDDGAAEIMTFSGVLAEAMHEHVTSISVADEFDAAAAVGDDFAFALDANYVESNSNKKGVSIIV